MNFPFTWTITVMAIGKQPSCLCTQATVEIILFAELCKMPDSEQCGNTAVASQCFTSKDITPSKSPVQIKDRLSAKKNTFSQTVHVELQRYSLYLNTHCTFNTAYWFNDYEDEYRHKLSVVPVRD